MNQCLLGWDKARERWLHREAKLQARKWEEPPEETLALRAGSLLALLLMGQVKRRQRRSH